MITAHPVEGQVNSLRVFVHCLDLRLKRKQNEVIIIKKIVGLLFQIHWLKIIFSRWGDKIRDSHQPCET